MLHDSYYDNYQFHVNNSGTSLLAANYVKHIVQCIDNDVIKWIVTAMIISGLTFDR